MNKEQLAAVKHIVCGTSRPAPYLVFGPPGTGKTFTLVEAIKQVPMLYILTVDNNFNYSMLYIILLCTLISLIIELYIYISMFSALTSIFYVN